MNEKLQYAEMLEIPVNTCNITYQPTKKRINKGKNFLEEIKEKLVKKVNNEESTQVETEAEKDEILCEETLSDGDKKHAQKCLLEYGDTEQTSTINIKNGKEKKPRKISIIGVQIFVICALIATIFLTSALLPNSGINAFFAGVFKAETIENQQSIDNRIYSDFSAVLPSSKLENVTLTDGVMALNGEGSIYAPCEGEITTLEKGDDGKFMVEITHNNNFKTVLNGIDHVYFERGSKVLSTIPVGYAISDSATACFYGSNGSMITDFTIAESGIIWAV